MFQTNSRPSSAKATESLWPSPQKPMIGGSVEKALKKLNGARLTAPAWFIVETQPTGRGTISALNGSRGIVVLSRKCGSMNMSIPYRCKGSPGKRVEDIAQNRRAGRGRGCGRRRPRRRVRSRAGSGGLRAEAIVSFMSNSSAFDQDASRLRPRSGGQHFRVACKYRHAAGQGSGRMPGVRPQRTQRKSRRNRHTNDHL